MSTTLRKALIIFAHYILRLRRPNDRLVSQFQCNITISTPIENLVNLHQSIPADMYKMLIRLSMSMCFSNRLLTAGLVQRTKLETR